LNHPHRDPAIADLEQRMSTIEQQVGDWRGELSANTEATLRVQSNTKEVVELVKLAKCGRTGPDAADEFSPATRPTSLHKLRWSGAAKQNGLPALCQHRQPVQRLQRVSGTLGGSRQVGSPLQFQF
jgi:hypothetical protein